MALGTTRCDGVCVCVYFVLNSTAQSKREWKRTRRRKAQEQIPKVGEPEQNQWHPEWEQGQKQT